MDSSSKEEKPLLTEYSDVELSKPRAGLLPERFRPRSSIGYLSSLILGAFLGAALVFVMGGLPRAWKLPKGLAALQPQCESRVRDVPRLS